MAEYQTVKAVRDRAKARIEEEAKVETEMKAASEADEKTRRDEAIQRAKEKARREEDLQTATDKDQRDEDYQRAKNKDKRNEDFHRATDKDKRDEDFQQAKNKDKRDEDFQKAVDKDKRLVRPEDSCVPVEVMEDEDLGPMPKPHKKFKWTPKKAIVVGLLVCLVLPAVLYGFIIPRADVTVRTWFNEGLLNSITVDAKVINDGTVEVSNLDLNISVMKEVKGVEVHIADLASYSSSVAIFSEKKFDSINFHDDENAQYVIEVKVSFDAGGSQVSKSYTHHVDQSYMNLYFNDQIQELAF